MGSSVSNSTLTVSSLRDGLSVVVITLNEENNLPSLLKDIPKGAQIIVVDSGSTDKTVAVAEGFGAQVHTRAFDNYAAQKNHAISLATTPWVLVLDADERPDQTLWQSVVAVVEGAGNQAASPASRGQVFSLTRRLVFLGRKMEHGRTKEQLSRLFKPGSAAYQNEIHEALKLSEGQEIKCLDGILWHHSYNNLDDYFARFNRYTTLMATNRMKQNVSSPRPVILAFRLPLDFLVRYVFRLGFLDGWQGFLWAVFGSFYGFVKYAKLIEKQQMGRLVR